MDTHGSTTEHVTFAFDDGVELTTGQIAYLVQEAVKEGGSLCTFVYRRVGDQVEIGCSSTFTTDNVQVAPSTDGPNFAPGSCHRVLEFVTPKVADWHAKPSGTDWHSEQIDTNCFPAAITAGLRLLRDHVHAVYERIKANDIPELELVEV